MKHMFIVTFLFSSLILSDSSVAGEQKCQSSIAELKNGTAVWQSADCGPVQYSNATMLLGNNAKDTELRLSIGYLELPSPGSGIRAKLYNENGAQIGTISFGEFHQSHQSCTNETVKLHANPGLDEFNYSIASNVKKAELVLWVGSGNFTKCP
jgi:hypothetical protein